jgi:hypothetical protein
MHRKADRVEATALDTTTGKKNSKAQRSTDLAGRKVIEGATRANAFD